MNYSAYTPGQSSTEPFNAAVQVVIGSTSVASVATGSASGTAGAATSSTSLAKPTSAANWTTNDLVGKWLKVTGGGGYSRTLPVLRPILSNTTTTAAVNEVVGMDSTTTFEIVELESFSSLSQGYDLRNVRSAVEVYGISFDASDDSLVAVTDCTSVVFSGCAFTANTASASVLASRVGRLRFEHCALSGGADVSVSDCMNVELHGIVSDAGGAISVANALSCAVTKLTANDAPSSVLRLEKVLVATAEVAASDGGATPVYLEDVGNFEAVGGCLTGTGNTGYGVEITGSGAAILTGSTITGGTGDVLFFGRAVTWANLSGTDYGIVEEHSGNARARASYTKSIKYGNYLFDGSVDFSSRVLSYGYFNFAQATGLTATGVDAGTSLQLGAQMFHRVDTVAASTGVRLPAGAALPGVLAIINNAGANTLTIYASAGGTVNGGASVTLAAGASKVFVSSSNDGLSWVSLT